MLAVITPVAGRHEHLLGQLRGLRASTRIPDNHVVVAMGDPDVADLVGDSAVVLDTSPVNGRLPLAAARNAGAERALAAGADVLVFLDVDCIPSPPLIERYAAAACQHPATLLSGPVAYLPPPTEGGYQLDRLSELGRAHPARPAVSENAVQALDYELFWSLSFALDAATWTALGGFCERYTGYGGEDTDFAQLARARRVAHRAVGGAAAYHQWHPSPEPPVQHLADIVRNASIFRERWGWWPMTGWMDAFQQLGLASYDHVSDQWAVCQTEPAAPNDTPQKGPLRLRVPTPSGH